jgi:plasminogen activator
MIFKNFKRSCICASAFLLSVSFPLSGFAESGKTNPTEPVTTTSIVRQPEGYSSDGPNAVTKSTDPVTVTSAIPEPSRAATDPVTTTSKNPSGVSSKSNIIDKQASLNINDHVVMVSGQLSMGVANGRARELVYDNGYKLSQLDWKLDNVFMIGAGVSIKPLSWLRFNGNVWLLPGDGNGTMDDYDWYVEGWDWTHWSHHSNVSVKEGTMYDINAELTFLRFNESSVFGIVGYKHDHWKWEARGGNFIYSEYYFRDTYFSLPDNELGITYEQTYDAPYIGIGFHANLNPITLDGRFIGSTLVSSSDKDMHHLKNIYFTDDFDSGHMFGIDFACTYNFTPHFAATAAFQYQKYEEITGDASALYLDSGEKYTWKDGAGISLESTLISLSLLMTL